MRICRSALILGLMMLVGAGPATTPSDVEDLKQKTLSEDFNVSRVALKALVGKGAIAKPVVREVAGELLTRDKAKVVENAGLVADVTKYKEIEQKLAAQRKLARDNIAVLEGEQTEKAAGANYRVLGQLGTESA